MALNFNTPQQINLHQVSAKTLTKYMHEGHFAPGSMKPKIEAVLNFVNHTGNSALITNPPNIARALKKETGTFVTKI